ncbi:unnamed protein product [Symbiodinium sp. CCMP2592]|nr:unnamed protein product [Symbiodinium sp. CCMP2592]
MRKRAFAQVQQEDEGSGPTPDQVLAGQQLRMFLLDRFCTGSLPGSDVAELCHYVTRAGGTGVATWALNPEQAARHGFEHIKLHAGKEYPEPDLDYVTVPLFEKRQSRRVAEKVPIMLPSTLFRKFVEVPSVQSKDEINFRKMLHNLPCYDNHPVVQRARAAGNTELVRPIALYWDGVRYSVHDSFTGFYVTDILSEQKFVSFLLRSEDMCRCGCRGWCSIFPLLQCDWPAYLEIIGGRFWNHNSHPCALCRISQDDMTADNVHSITLDNVGHLVYSSEDYNNDIGMFTREILVDTAEMLRTIARNLEYSRLDRGRHLTADLPRYGLRKNWRLEPSRRLPDVSQLEYQELPLRVIFWIAPRDARLTHMCPLFSLEGVTQDSWSIDIMHAWHLGPMQQFISLAMHSFIASGVFSPRSVNIEASELRELALLAIKAELFQFYKNLRSTDQRWREKGSEVWNLTMGMIGNEDTYNLSAKAAESHGLLRFVLWLLHKYADEFAKQPDELARKFALLTACAEAAHAMDELLELEFRQFTRQHCQALLQLYLRFLTLYLKAGGVWRPKCHLLVHMIQRALHRGNPRLYSTYRDESLKGVIAKIARSAHRSTWSNVIHWKCNFLQQKKLEDHAAEG